MGPRHTSPERSQLSPAEAAAQPESLASLPWPEGTQVLRFEDLEGAILLRATLVPKSGRDTSGVFVLDTGAGFLALDLELARLLGIADSAAGPRRWTWPLARSPVLSWVACRWTRSRPCSRWTRA